MSNLNISDEDLVNDIKDFLFFRTEVVKGKSINVATNFESNNSTQILKSIMEMSLDFKAKWESVNDQNNLLISKLSNTFNNDISKYSNKLRLHYEESDDSHDVLAKIRNYALQNMKIQHLVLSRTMKKLLNTVSWTNFI